MSTPPLETSPLLSAWSDPVSGVKSHLLARRVAPLQQSFYYVNRSFSDDGRFLWIYCAFPPAGNANQGRSLAVVDFKLQEVRHFPETGFLDASPAVDPATGEAFWCTGLEIWKRGPLAGDPPSFVNRFPPSLARNRRPWRLATHLTFSADRKSLNIDAEIGRQFFVGHAPLDGGEVVIWQELDRAYNHGQFSPVDPDLQLINQDSAIDPVTGACPNYENRMWLLRRGGQAAPIFADAVASGAAMHGHEWWSADGRHVWYIHYGRGAMRVNPFTPAPKAELMWPSDTVSHAHTDATESYVVADCQPGVATGISKVVFFNRKTGREVAIVSQMPYPPDELRRYHVHPHPQFCLDDRYICYTTIVLGRVDVALVSVESLLALTS
ncbi:MAG: hypothetical protein K0R17_2895 [Rariglobus sp.]|jgi:hypothetical protein|nr:hypothetical protein [Rariglobus sp.]